MSTMLPVTGDTYPCRSLLRGLGGRWDAETKVWLVPADRHAAAQFTVNATARKPRPPRAPGEIRFESPRGRHAVGDVVQHEGMDVRVIRLSRPFYPDEEDVSYSSGWVPGSEVAMVNVYAVPVTD